MIKLLRILVVVCGLLPVILAEAGDAVPAKPSSKDKCPVCGMFVAKYPDFLAQILYRDGSWVFFDGAKDMFKYYFDIRRYHPSRNLSDIEAVYVTDYYNLSPIQWL